MRWLKKILQFGGRAEKRAELLRQRGDQLAKDGSYQDAVDAYKESIESDAHNHSTYIKLAEAYYNMRERAEADAVLEKLVELDPRNTATYRELLGFYLSTAQWNKAPEAAEKCMALGVKDTNYYLAESVAASANWERERVIQAAQTSIELDPTNADAYYMLGLWYEEAQADEAIAAFKKSLEINPENANAELSLAATYFTAGRFDESASTYEQIINRSGNYYSTLFLLARSYAYLERHEDALEAMRKALNDFWACLFISPSLYAHIIKTIEHMVESDSDALRGRTACLFASYVSFFFARHAGRMDGIKQAKAAVEACLSWYEKALRYAEPAGERDPLEWQIHYHVGEEYARMDVWRYEEACEAFQRSVALHSGAYGTHEMVESLFPLAMLSESSVKAGRLQQGIDALQKHLALLRSTERTVREGSLALEAQSLEPDDPRLLESSIVLQKCAEQETKDMRTLAELILKRDGEETEGRDR
jgi:tetratricopeptide (TPR) repeat protein